MVIGLTGKNGSGKSAVADYLKEKGYQYYSLSDVLRAKLKESGKEITRDNLFELGNKLRDEEGAGVLAKLLLELINDEGSYVIDSIRHPEEVKVLRENTDFIFLEVIADDEIRFSRMKQRAREGDPDTLEGFLALEKKEASSELSSDQQLLATLELADYKIQNSSTLEVLYDNMDALLKQIKKHGD